MSPNSICLKIRGFTSYILMYLNMVIIDYSLYQYRILSWKDIQKVVSVVDPIFTLYTCIYSFIM